MPLRIHPAPRLRAQSKTEYILLVSLIAAAAVLAFFYFGQGTGRAFQDSVAALDQGAPLGREPVAVPGLPEPETSGGKAPVPRNASDAGKVAPTGASSAAGAGGLLAGRGDRNPLAYSGALARRTTKPPVADAEPKQADRSTLVLAGEGTIPAAAFARLSERMDRNARVAVLTDAAGDDGGAAVKRWAAAGFGRAEAGAFEKFAARLEEYAAVHLPAGDAEAWRKALNRAGAAAPLGKLLTGGGAVVAESGAAAALAGAWFAAPAGGDAAQPGLGLFAGVVDAGFDPSAAMARLFAAAQAHASRLALGLPAGTAAVITEGPTVEGVGPAPVYLVDARAGDAATLRTLKEGAPARLGR